MIKRRRRIERLLHTCLRHRQRTCGGIGLCTAVERPPTATRYKSQQVPVPLEFEYMALESKSSFERAHDAPRRLRAMGVLHPVLSRRTTEESSHMTHDKLLIVLHIFTTFTHARARKCRRHRYHPPITRVLARQHPPPVTVVAPPLRMNRVSPGSNPPSSAASSKTAHGGVGSE